MHGLLEQRWLDTASHAAALWGEVRHPSGYAPEAAPQAEG